MFSLNFSSAGKRPFMAVEGKNMCQRLTFLCVCVGGGGGGGSGVIDLALPLLGNLGANKVL